MAAILFIIAIATVASVDCQDHGYLDKSGNSGCSQCLKNLIPNFNSYGVCYEVRPELQSFCFGTPLDGKVRISGLIRGQCFSNCSMNQPSHCSMKCRSCLNATVSEAAGIQQCLSVPYPYDRTCFEGLPKNVIDSLGAALRGACGKNCTSTFHPESGSDSHGSDSYGSDSYGSYGDSYGDSYGEDEY